MIVRKINAYNRKKESLKKLLTKRGWSGIIINVVSARATTTAILENDIVKTDKQEQSSRRPRGREPERERTKNSQISERDNGLEGAKANLGL